MANVVARHGRILYPAARRAPQWPAKIQSYAMRYVDLAVLHAPSTFPASGAERSAAGGLLPRLNSLLYPLTSLASSSSTSRAPQYSPTNAIRTRGGAGIVP